MPEEAPTTKTSARLAALLRPVDSPPGTVPALLVARFLGALIWAWGVKSKAPWKDFGWFPGWIDKEIQYAELSPYRWFLETVVQPHVTFFGWMQFLTEAVLALLLLLGLFSGLAGLASTLWAANIVLGSYPIPGEWIFGILSFLTVYAVVWGTRPGRYYGLDARLRPKLLEHEKAWVRWIARHGM